jgi:hypothetical protein
MAGVLAMSATTLPREGQSIFGPNARPDYKIDHETGCWVWQKSAFRGYAQSGGSKRKPYKMYYELAHGPVPDGHQVHHKCRNKLCVNPEHLEALAAREHHALHFLHERGRTLEDVREIRRLGRTGVSAKELVRRFGFSESRIYYFWRGEAWADLLGEEGRVEVDPWPCVLCGEPVVGKNRNAKYCSPECRNAAKRAFESSRYQPRRETRRSGGETA